MCSCKVMSDSCDPMDCSMPGSCLLHNILEFAQIHVHWVWHSAAPFTFCLPTFPASELYQFVYASHQVAKVLVLQLQQQSFQWIFRVDFLSDGLVWSPCSPRDSQDSSPTPQFKTISSSALRLDYDPTLTSIHDCWKKIWLGLNGPLWAKWYLYFLIHCLGLS